MTERERLAKIETEQGRLAQEANDTRRALRLRYSALVADLAVETFSEREFT